MNNRHSNTERFGVNETEKIVIKQLDWIFREQPIADVGLDAIIEQSNDGNPTGQFIAIQIKSGRGNFHISDKKLVYYVSNIHYNYWLNLNIPIIFIAHLPDTEKTYWQEISESSLKKTNKRWKIEIPFKQEFNYKSKKRLVEILSNKEDRNLIFELYKGKLEVDTVFDIAEKTECISEAVVTVNNIIDIINELREKNINFNLKLSSFVENGLSDMDAQVKASIKGFGRDLNITSKRLENEVELFSKLYSEGIYAFEKVVLVHYLITKNTENLKVALQSLNTIPNSVDNAINGINVLRGGVSKLPKKYSVLKEARILFIEVIDMLINEFEEAGIMANIIITKINNER